MKKINRTQKEELPYILYRKNLDMEVSETDKVANYFTNPRKLWRLQDIIKNPMVVPQTRGIYGWYFKKIPLQILNNDMIHNLIDIKGWKLLYLGIAPKNQSSKSTLNKRITEKHLKEHSASSTLRLSLGCLLKEELELRLIKKNPEKKFEFDQQGEKKLTSWMTRIACVAWIENKQPWKVEKDIFKKYGKCLPLNLQNNKEYNPFYSELKKLRKKCRQKAYAALL